MRTPEEIALNAGGDLPRLVLPQPGVFAERALRLRQLAAGHPMRDYLLLMAVLAEAQHARLAGYPAVTLPTAAQADAASQRGEALLDASVWPRDAVWRDEWRALIRHALEHLPPDSPARPSVEAALSLTDEALETQAGRLLTGVSLGLDMALAPLVAAGLQLFFTRLVMATQAALPGAFGYTDDEGRCPCCASLPLASVTRVGGETEGHRYLHCTLCNAEWHMVRVKCTHCRGTGAVRFRSLEAVAAPDDAAAAKRPSIQAETCDDCGHYLKIVHMTQDVQVEPVADDLATLTLDLLVSDAGYARHGTNLLLLFGEADTDSADDTGEPPPAPRGPH
ncbi:formate dehydrogenase accessory protein FdhE [Ottowia flava]|uniref:Formate dehydrogenase accessory protein FdhE n=1 Tax=Ottowia flava TaxID=2675430 RepID=A0ABW4KUA9_9BURK|nr:formate dehydrogenase accessory protein FdhE [Ottowia sp. GY511]